ncbi:hypothetical protein BDZ88DRAFT_336464 [Geranomyces variabilis]|nr:hypothetical protein BDZ88DRAFT_336464 [Geranomyces variabilis]
MLLCGGCLCLHCIPTSAVSRSLSLFLFTYANPIIMVSSADKHAPRVVVLGITGAQGGSVATALLASEKPYRIVGLTRDANKDSAKKLSDMGVEMVSIDLAAASQDVIDQAFVGADIVFVSRHRLVSLAWQGR